LSSYTTTTAAAAAAAVAGVFGVAICGVGFISLTIVAKEQQEYSGLYLLTAYHHQDEYLSPPTGHHLDLHDFAGPLSSGSSR